MRRLSVVVVFVLVVLVSTLGAAPAEAAKCNKQEIIPLNEAVPVTGSSKLCVKRKGMRGDMWVEGLVKDEAYTVWWGYFDDPSKCVVSGACGPEDFGGKNPLAVFGRMDSAVGKSSGEAHFVGSVNGMKPSHGSQIWLIIIGHGPVDRNDGRHQARQLLTPEDAAAGAPHLGVKGGPIGAPAALGLFLLD